MNTSKWYVSVLVGLIFLFPIGVRADSNNPEMKINASFETYYKSQTNYRTVQITTQEPVKDMALIIEPFRSQEPMVDWSSLGLQVI